MKWFLGFLALVGIYVIVTSSSCGPTKPFCPSNPPDFSCFDKDGNAVGGQGGVDQGPCDGGLVYSCAGVTQCKPCGT